MKFTRYSAWAVAGVAAVVLGLVLARVAPVYGRHSAFAQVARRGDLCFQAGQHAEAEACWRLVLDAEPGSVSVRNRLVVLCLNSGRFDEAGRLLAVGIEQRPTVSSFRYNLALLRFMEGRYDDALASAREVERLSPMHGEIHFLKGVIYEKLGETDLAQKEFIQELNVDPATPEAWVKIGVLPAGAHVVTIRGISGDR